MKIALATLFGNPPNLREWSDWMEEDKDYIRTTEVIEVEFVDLPAEEVVPQQVAFIDDSIKEAREKFAVAIKALEDEKAKLLAITHQAE